MLVPDGRLQKKLVVLILLSFVGGMGWLAYLVTYHSLGEPVVLAKTALVTLLIAAAGLFPLPVGPRFKAKVTSTPLFAAALLLPPGNAALAAVIGGLTYLVVLKTRGDDIPLPWFKFPFNAGETILSIGAASLVFHLLSGDGPAFASPAVAAAAAVMVLVNTGLVCVAASLHGGLPFATVWWTGARGNGLAEVSLYALGLLAAVAFNESPWLLIVLLTPVGIIYLSFSRLGDTNARLEEALKQLKDIQGRLVGASKLASVGSLSLDLAHQLNNPLFVLTARLEGLERSLPVGTSQRQRVDSAVNATRRIRNLMNSFLGSSRNEWGRVQPDVVVEEALRMARSNNGKNVEIRRNYASDLPAVRCNRPLLREALSNLFSNALQATPAGSELDVEISPGNGSVTVRITDQGPGIPKEHMPHIFEPFNTTRPGGLGLGLFSAKHLVEMHEGTVTLESVIGQGTRVMVDLPSASPQSAYTDSPFPTHSQSDWDSVPPLVTSDVA